MKVCPECKSTFEEESLTNCPKDGAKLLEKAKDTNRKPTNQTSQAESLKRLLPVIGMFLLLGLIGGGFYWFSQAGKNQETGEVIDAYKELYTAVQEKNTGKIKQMMSQASLKFVEGVAAQRKKPVAEILENGLYASTINPEMPEVRDERIKDDKFAAVEVFVKKTGRYEQVYFVKEDGAWKVAVGDLFANTFQHPEKSKAQKEADASNTMIPYDPNVNGNFQGGKPNANNPAATNANVKTIEVEPANKIPQPDSKTEKKK